MENKKPANQIDNVIKCSINELAKQLVLVNDPLIIVWHDPNEKNKVIFVPEIEKLGATVKPFTD